jgi:hypothetical protein
MWVSLNLSKILVAAGLLFFSLLNFLQTPAVPSIPVADQAGKTKAIESYKNFPLSFVANHGQAGADVKYLTQGLEYSLFLSKKGTLLTLSKSDSRGDRTQRTLQMQLLGTAMTPVISGIDPLEGKVNYLKGNEKDKWLTNVPTYAKVKYQNVYEGIDLVYYGNQEQLEYDFVVAPGANPNNIALSYTGADKIEINSEGTLVLHLGDGQLQMQKPLVYQVLDEVRHEVNGRYLLADNRVRFQIDQYDTSKPLVIDPVLSYSTYLGGSSNSDSPSGIAVDTDGNAYIVGVTNQTDFPTQDAFDSSLGGSQGDAFVTKLAPDGSSLIYSTYLGGNSQDGGTGKIVVDSSGSAYVAGFTKSTDFPVVNAFQPTMNTGALGTVDGFVSKLSPSGDSLIYSTYLGGSNSDYPQDITINNDGNAYVMGWTFSSDFPTQNPFQANNANNTSGSNIDTFVTKLSGDGASLIYSTYLGGTGLDFGWGIAIDDSNYAYVTGSTLSTNFPTTAGVLQPTRGPGAFSAYVTKLNQSGNALVFSTFLGSESEGYGIAVDSTGSVYVSGNTSYSGFPLVNPLDSTKEGNYDAYVSKFNSDGSALLFSTFLGGNAYDSSAGLFLDDSGNMFVAGSTTSTDFPVVDAFQDTRAGSYDAFVTEINSAGSAIVFSSYLGGSDTDFLTDIAVDAGGSIYVNGATSSFNFPTVNAFQSTKGSGDTVFIAKISPIILVDPITVSTNPVAVNTEFSASANFTDPSPNSSYSATWDWGDGNTSEGVITQTDGSGTITGTHSYSTSGLYSINVVVTDSGGSMGQPETPFQYLVVYDPDGGFVTGAGTITSPEGAYVTNPSISGKAIFGFVSKYHNGANMPSGTTQFKFTSADFVFKSTSYDWLVIGGPKAQYKGSGTINGAGDYGFILTAIDGQVNGGGDIDKLRLKVYDKNTDEIIYDNQSESPDGSDPTTAIDSGSIVIHH